MTAPGRGKSLIGLILLASSLTPRAASPGAPQAPAFETYSKYDFVPGEKIVAAEDFMQDAIGDFPARWNTDGSAEIVTIAGQEGRWLKVTRAGFFTPEFITDLPENVTVELDLAVPPDYSGGFPLEISLVQLKNLKQPAAWQDGPNYVTFTAFPGYSGNASEGLSSVTAVQEGAGGDTNNTKTPQLAVNSVLPGLLTGTHRFAHISYFKRLSPVV